MWAALRSVVSALTSGAVRPPSTRFAAPASPSASSFGFFTSGHFRQCRKRYNDFQRLLRERKRRTARHVSPLLVRSLLRQLPKSMTKTKTQARNRNARRSSLARQRQCSVNRSSVSSGAFRECVFRSVRRPNFFFFFSKLISFFAKILEKWMCRRAAVVVWSCKKKTPKNSRFSKISA